MSVYPVPSFFRSEPLRPNPLRIALGVFALTTAGLGAAGLIGSRELAAEAISGHNSDAPVNTAADRIELQDKAGRVILSGNVDITQAELHLKAARTVVAYTNNGGLQIHRADASGDVIVTRGNETARGDVGVYDFDARIITMVGNVSLQRGTDKLNGARLVMDLNTGVSSVDGHAASTPASPGDTTGNTAGRVFGTFSVPKKTS